MPFLFRTPPGINLWVKGPANWIKDGVQPLEGVVETDWLASTFTMNWKITRVCEWVRFEKDEPFCMLVPVPRGLAESLVPRREPIDRQPGTAGAVPEVGGEPQRVPARTSTNATPNAVKQGWQKDYFQGQDAGRQADRVAPDAG